MGINCRRSMPYIDEVDDPLNSIPELVSRCARLNVTIGSDSVKRHTKIQTPLPSRALSTPRSSHPPPSPFSCACTTTDLLPAIATARTRRKSPPPPPPQQPPPPPPPPPPPTPSTSSAPPPRRSQHAAAAGCQAPAECRPCRRSGRAPSRRRCAYQHAAACPGPRRAMLRVAHPHSPYPGLPPSRPPGGDSPAAAAAVPRPHAALREPAAGARPAAPGR